MNLDLRWIIILLANALLILLVAEINHYLARVSLHVFAGGLLMTFAALRLQLKPAFLANGFTALLIDALTPMPPGVMFLMLMTVHAAIFSFRGNFTKESPSTGAGIAITANALLMLLLSLIFAGETTHAPSYWQRVAVDMVLSQIIVGAGAAWFFALQDAALRMVGIHLDAEQRQAQ